MARSTTSGKSTGRITVTEFITADVLSLLAVSFGVGIVVGLTGMGGGALMTPALIFLGVPPTTAVANDLVAAAVNKSVGAAVHWRRGSPHLRLAALLVVSSVPFAFAGAFVVEAIGANADQEKILKYAIGCALLLTAATFTLRVYLVMRAHALGLNGPGDTQDMPLRVVPTIIVGAVGGSLVGVTSVGAGSLIMVAMVLLYPALSARRLVGTDLVQAIPLVGAAAISHVIVSGITWTILIPLILGGMPGTYLGARLSTFVPQGVIRRGIAIVLTLTGLALLGVSPTWVGLIGGGLLILGPAGWAGLRVLHGLPALDDSAYTSTREPT